MRIAQEMFDPIPLDDDPVLDETLRPFGRDPVGGLVRALEADRVSIPDRAQISSLVEKIKTGAYAIDPLAMDDDPPPYPHRMLAIFAEKYATGETEPLHKRRADVDPSPSCDPIPLLDDDNVLAKGSTKRDRARTLEIGMRVKGMGGQIGKIRRINGSAVEIEYANASEIVLYDHVQLAA